MEVLYVVGNNRPAPINDPLRYSLRSIEKYARGIDKVYVVGYPPQWLSGKVETLTVDDISTGKHWNILNCIRVAVHTFGLSRDFLYSSDDHYLLKDIDFDAFPYFSKGKLYSYEEYVKSKGRDPGKYQKSIIATRRLMDALGMSIEMSCCHRNTHMDGRYVDDAWDIANASKHMSIYGFEPSCLMNALRNAKNPVVYTEISQTQDIKVKTVDDIIDAVNLGCTFFSSSPVAEDNQRVINWMQKHYDIKSKWER